MGSPSPVVPEKETHYKSSIEYTILFTCEGLPCNGVLVGGCDNSAFRSAADDKVVCSLLQHI